MTNRGLDAFESDERVVRYVTEHGSVYLLFNHAYSRNGELSRSVGFLRALSKERVNAAEASTWKALDDLFWTAGHDEPQIGDRMYIGNTSHWHLSSAITEITYENQHGESS